MIYREYFPELPEESAELVEVSFCYVMWTKKSRTIFDKEKTTWSGNDLHIKVEDIFFLLERYETIKSIKSCKS